MRMCSNPAIILGGVRTSGREIHDQPGHQILDKGIGGMGFGELFQVMGVFELQHWVFSGHKKTRRSGL